MEYSEESISKRALITVRGIVQGVGFRPFVYREAKRLGIRGYVINTGEGVFIDAQGKEIERFLSALQSDPPHRARIDTIEILSAPQSDYTDFEIRSSEEGSEGAVAIPQESAVCDACIREMHDPSDRRYGYPFINCTDCGPRYTILQIPPYDRVRTSMKHFTMCDACYAEYTDPSSRRYHAEPISCPDCGPTLGMYDHRGMPLEGDPISLTLALLREGKIVALKGLGGFHLLCDATNDSAVRELRHRKHRPAKPLAVMFGSLDEIRRYADISDTERSWIDGAVKPIVVVRANGSASLSASVAPGVDRIGVFLPYTPLHRLLFDRIDFPLVATSANISDEPIIIQREEVVRRLGNVADAILDHDRPIVNALDDAVLQCAGEKTVMLRMGRGFAPLSFPLDQTVSTPFIALGAHQKNAIALGLHKNLVLSGHIGDLGSVDADEYFERTIHTFKRFYDFEPKALVHDLHPQYTSTLYAHSRGKLHRFPVQHHYAHILACMAEHSLHEKVLGFAFDGTGYGEKGKLWGGEAMIADVHRYERVVSIKPFALLGGDKAVKEPRRIALSLLFESYSLEEVLEMEIPSTEAFLSHEIRQLHHMWIKKLNSPMSSSMGRVFDAVASLGGFVQMLEYEGQGGLIMEGYVDEHIGEPFEFRIEEEQIDLSDMIAQIVGIVRDTADADAAKRQIASRFIATVDAIIQAVSGAYPDLAVIVSGGVFQNRVLMERLYRSFSHRRFFAQEKSPVNDGAIALGQAWWGIHNF